MVEISPNSRVYISKGSHRKIFYFPSSRQKIATRLLRCFYTVDEMKEAASLRNLKDADTIVEAIIACALNYQGNLEMTTQSKLKKALHNVMSNYCRRFPKKGLTLPFGDILKDQLEDIIQPSQQF